jgi:hypothetical protein
MEIGLCEEVCKKVRRFKLMKKKVSQKEKNRPSPKLRIGIRSIRPLISTFIEGGGTQRRQYLTSILSTAKVPGIRRLLYNWLALGGKIQRYYGCFCSAVGIKR